MGVPYNTTIIYELEPGESPALSLREMFPVDCPDCGDCLIHQVVSPYCSPYGTWIIARGERRFQVVGFYIRSWMIRLYPERERLQYRHFLEHLLSYSRALVSMGAWEDVPFRESVEAPSEFQIPERPDAVKCVWDKYGLLTADISAWTAEELAYLVWARRHPIDALMEGRLADLRGWIVYLGERLVAQYGRERLMAGPFYKVEPTLGGLTIHLEPDMLRTVPSIEAWENLPSLDVQRKYLGIDVSWIDRVDALKSKRFTGLGIPPAGQD